MKKTIKYTSALLAILTLSIASLPSATSVYANTQQVSSTNETLTPIESLTDTQKDSLANEIQALHPDVSKEWIEEVIERQLQNDYTLPTTNSYFRSAWQGITVNQMGAAIDTAISLALGGTTAGLANLIKVKGKHEVKSAIRSAAAKYLGGWIVNSVFIDYAMNLLSPGTYLAQQWDANDAIPNNGRINF